MGAKRHHQKSKLGCTNCRQRKIKCDETQGGCLKCEKRNYLCSLRPHEAAQGPATSSARLLRQQAVLAPSPTGSDFTNALLQQDVYNRLSYIVRPHAGRLFHHFASDTITSMGYGTTIQQAWCTAIPDLALKHDFVAHGVLAVTALHISTTLDSMEAKQTYMKMAALELNVGLRQYMRQLSKVSSNNVEALFAFSTILSVFGSSQAANSCQRLINSEPSASTGTQTNILEAVNIVSHAVRTIRGAQVILVPGWTTLQGGPLRNVVMRESWDDLPPVSSVHANEDRRLAMLESMWSNPQRIYEDYFETLRQTWQSLRATFKIVWSLKDNTSLSHTSSGPLFDWTSIFHFAFSCSLDFLNLIEQQCIEAWVLAAHYGCLVMDINGLWWVGPSARNLVTTAALVIGTQNWEWIAWPAAVVGVNLESLRQLALDRPRICP